MENVRESGPVPEIVGRERELARIAGVLDAVDSRGGVGAQVLALTAEPGAGKSTLVDWAAARAASRGFQVLRARAGEGEEGFGFAGLHQLLRPLLGEAGRLPAPQREALLAAFGQQAAAGDRQPDPLLIRYAALSLLSDAATDRRLLLLVDDVQWLDQGSVDVLAFVARRLDGEAIAVLLAAREEGLPGPFEREFAVLAVTPLDRADAGLLLDRQPQPPRGRARLRIFEQAGGNPLALIELARAVAREPGGAQGADAAESLPLTGRLERIFAADLVGLPQRTRQVLLVAAAAGTAQFSEVLRATPDAGDPQVWLPAEQVGLVRLAAGQVRLRHPLVRSAVYQAASFDERRAAHQALAAALVDHPDRRAWHLAAATLGPDEEVARTLAESADRARGRGGYAAAAATLERAAALTPDRDQRARRLLEAATMAMYGGCPQWVGELAVKVCAIADDPELLAQASMRAGWSLAVTTRHEEALGFLVPVAQSMAGKAPGLAMDALGTAATPAYNSGSPFYRAELRRLADLVPEQPDEVDRVWLRAGTEPFADRAWALRALPRSLAEAPEDSLPHLAQLGAAAWVLDETELAVRLLGQAMDHLRRTPTAGGNPVVGQALALALFESGAWSVARSTAQEAYRMAVEVGADNSAVGSPILQGTLLALHGDAAGARGLIDTAVAGVDDLSCSPSLFVRSCHALGLAAFVEGDHLAAYRQLRAVFSRDFQAAPVHYHASYYYLGDLAAAAVRTGYEDDARAVLRVAVRSLGELRSARLDVVVNRACALLSGPDEAEQHFRAALADPAGDLWPFERALVRLEFGEWLRRHRRVTEARAELSAALGVFERLDARPWTERAASELRAAGVPTARTESASRTSDLTPQQLEIARAAASGLTNREIGAKLLLSPRTVGFHLHKIFPKLGITTRTQLRDALGDAQPAD
ncbi:DNA-binding CsgD family transcriptional regulator [Kitasatospora sp. MAA19]|uniref:ATP-binding protein n=1 Tax=Kitasatospora sp. MAA19 TaxID=3035090 RepID=UPI0024746D7F|nr:LuxR family transcriptional regulator [Kitasatospora sp. MAA19]MDH6708380.1 DNA-binding CsgD family transcriptional regulator [Kitasatospora sp. MAA19]